MSTGEVKFTFMTIVYSVTLVLVMSTFEGPAQSAVILALKLGYSIPTLLLMVDMWIHYNNYHKGGRERYGEKELFIDTTLLALVYLSISKLKEVPLTSDAAQLKDYPPQLFWFVLIPYCLLKTYRAWPMGRSDGAKGWDLSWYSLLHAALLALITVGYLWQQGLLPSPIPFYLSGVAFTVIVLVYLVVVYGFGRNPLTPVFRRRRVDGVVAR